MGNGNIKLTRLAPRSVSQKASCGVVAILGKSKSGFKKESFLSTHNKVGQLLERKFFHFLKKLDNYRIVLYKRIMAKRKYMIYVDEDVYGSLRKLVEARGMALSPYIESLLRENLIALNELKDVKTFGDISVSQLFKLFSQSITDMQHAAKKSKK